jgi:trk system potassium uptake protein TrkA
LKIIILGAGQVGANLAISLVSEANDITVVDLDGAKLSALQDRYDLRTVCGMASHPSVLREAGADDADMLIAVTQNDETNMVACKIAATLFNIPTKIARIRAQDYTRNAVLFKPEHMAVDFVISPEQEVTYYLRRLIDYPEALQVVDFADGRIRLVAVKAQGGFLVGHALKEMRKHLELNLREPGKAHLHELDARVAAIFRRDRTIVPEGDTIVQEGDEIFYIAATDHLRAVMKEMRRSDKSVRRVMIAGGGNIGRRLAEALENDYVVKIIDHDKAHAQGLAETLKNTLVLVGDVTDEELLLQENIDDMDVFCALTNDDDICLKRRARRVYRRARVICATAREPLVDVGLGELDISHLPELSQRFLKGLRVADHDDRQLIGFKVLLRDGLHVGNRYLLQRIEILRIIVLREAVEFEHQQAADDLRRGIEIERKPVHQSIPGVSHFLIRRSGFLHPRNLVHHNADRLVGRDALSLAVGIKGPEIPRSCLENRTHPIR